nr:hypothetical protein GCM10020241_27350 [Streptoalloteichus tenebrarius]
MHTVEFDENRGGCGATGEHQDGLVTASPFTADADLNRLTFQGWHRSPPPQERPPFPPSGQPPPALGGDPASSLPRADPPPHPQNRRLWTTPEKSAPVHPNIG